MELAAMPAIPTPQSPKNHRRESSRARASWNAAGVFMFMFMVMGSLNASGDRSLSTIV
jgi:hypothetical protein